MTKATPQAIGNKALQLRGVFPFEFDEAKAPAIPEWIHLIPIGQWEHDGYGPIIITASDINEYKFNFDNGVRKGVFITAGHEGFAELPAQGWIKEVEARPTGLWGRVDWNEIGKETLSDKQYKFFSPELCPVYEDPETHAFYRNVICGGALTKSPYFKELEAIIFSEKNIKKFNATMDIKVLAAKNVADLTDEEKAYLKAHKEELTDDQKAALTSVLDVETDEEKEAREKKEGEDKAAADKAAADKEAADKAAADQAAADAAAAGGVDLSDKGMVKISAAELAILRNKADQGQQAFSELQKAKLDNSVSTLLFSEGNKAGTFLPKSKDKLRAFMETLNEAQRASFSGLIAELPKSNIFSEAGAGQAAVEGSAMAEVEAKVGAKIKASEGKLGYSEALKQVMSENQGLEERYDRELVPLRGKAA